MAKSKKSLTAKQGADGFLVEPSSPDYRWHKLFSEFLDGLPRPIWGKRINFASDPAVKSILAASPAEQIGAIGILVNRRVTNERAFRASGSRSAMASDSAYALGKLTVFLLNRKLPHTSASLTPLISAYVSARNRRFFQDDAPVLLKICQKLEAEKAVLPDLYQAIEKLAASLDPGSEGDDWEGAPERRVRQGFEALL